ncbi:MAG: class I SAM-dependent rRNA methyltransferase [Bacteroidaceae bacterium]|nr:class I SAM-dependent rRNA methyltransferase [Bacteroidaceae bacterium]
MNNKVVVLKKGKEDSLRRFHPWVYSGAIHHIEGKPDEGDLVDVVSADGAFLAKGHIQIGSIAVRVLSFDEKEPVDASFWQHRLQVALEVRRAIGLFGNPQTNSFRLVHGEGDGLPGLIIDVYGSTAVMQAHSVGMHVCRHDIAEALADVLSGTIENIYYKSETTLPYKANLTDSNGYLLGGNADDVAIENGLRFHVDWMGGQKTGFFVDQRENRALLEKYSLDRRVLNMFCYTGGFSFYAMRGGARLVHSVDSSARAIDITRANVELNFPGDERHQAFATDAFEFLDKMPSCDAEDAYDLIVLDPPAFAKHRDALHNALQGYRKLNAKALQKIKPGGILFTFSCSQAVNKDQFRTSVFTAAAISGRKVRILHQLHQPADHPINIYHPEGEYLKGLVLYVE